MSIALNPAESHAVNGDRAAELFRQHQFDICVRTDKLFAGLMLLQWIAAIAAACWISPRTWAGATSEVHPHVWAAVFLGGAVTALPVFLAMSNPGATITRFSIACGQMLMSALLIHLTGGRIETHFHVFGSLAFLAFYRDWRVFLPATAVVAADHLLRGVFWPRSVFGIATAETWRWLEHAGWVLLTDLSATHASAALVRIASLAAKGEVEHKRLKKGIQTPPCPAL
jgi:hypothetical protein